MDIIITLVGSPIHQHQMAQDQQLRHPKAESTSPIHQFYAGVPENATMPDYQKYSSRDHNFKISDATLGLPPENYQVSLFLGYV